METGRRRRREDRIRGGKGEGRRKVLMDILLAFVP
jgi:hypothetical protein